VLLLNKVLFVSMSDDYSVFSFVCVFFIFVCLVGFCFDFDFSLMGWEKGLFFVRVNGFVFVMYDFFVFEEGSVFF
jgi:hypothetical protein